MCRAVDLLVLFDGFKPTGGSITEVSIYPSEFGVKRLAEEEQLGPAELRREEDCSDDKEAERYGFKFTFWKIILLFNSV